VKNDRRKRATWGCTLAILLATLAPAVQSMNASADQRCTPAAHVVDATQIPTNGSSNPNGHPDEQYKDQLGVNCIPTFELDFAGAIDNPAFPKGTCTPESKYDVGAAQIAADAAWMSKCRRLKFTMGPLIARPGMNDTMLHVTTIEKPGYDGYTLRWKPGLQAADGQVPPVENLHLHHGTWIGGVNGPTAATGPFFATGEEQTILQYPKGYGWSWAGQSAWIMIYMVHNALPQAQAVYITYDIDYISTEDAAELGGIRDTKSIWMDVGGSGGRPITSTGGTIPDMKYYSSFNPIFNAQRGYGHDDTGAYWNLTGESGALETKPVRNNAGTGGKVCYWPRENCATFNSAQGVTPQQGIPKLDVIGNKTGIPANAFGGLGCAPGTTAGTLVNMGGHLHPGGLRDEVSVKRGNKIVPIHISDAVYWDHEDPTKAGGPPTSWDLSMTGTLGWSAGTGRARDAWKVTLRPGDELILNGVYDTTIGSTYDQMGIVMSWVSPGCDPDAIDPFDSDVILDAGWVTGPKVAARPDGLPAAIDRGCTPGTVREGDADAGANGENVGKTVLCLRGNVTHGSMVSRQNHSDCGNCAPLAPVAAQLLPTQQCSADLNDTDSGECLNISMEGFTYGPLDMGVAANVMPQVKKGTTMTFVNPDTAAMIWHTVTRCKAPCTGATSASYPLADGGWMEENVADLGRARTDWASMDFESAILCAGLGCADEPVTKWSFKPSRTGVFTFWCRIHPTMRGAFEVVA
jgi:hypothetical protein